MTLQCMFSDDDLTLMSNNSEYESSVTSTILTSLLTYTASSVRSVKNVLLNRDHYTMHILFSLSVISKILIDLNNSAHAHSKIIILTFNFECNTSHKVFKCLYAF